ncbi:hypothetical protein PspLS_09103 [Pyricularia sp. CBS 133598]|nr:hypothetical protein PspLS_09103 [Pyricularia sp. CBS 133598]
MAEKTNPFPTVEETLKHPAYPTAIWKLVPHKKGHAPVGEGRGGPFNIGWEIHGSGPTKLVMIIGLGSFCVAWQCQTLYFGHEKGDQYSVLLIDNRGMGNSDVPLMRYSTSEMALDVLEVATHVGWTDRQSLHVIGISLGGMIAQEVACASPERIASLALLSTAAEIRNTDSFLVNLQNRAALLIPRGIEVSVGGSAKRIFAKDWLESPDAFRVPTKDSPRVDMPEGGEYLRFNSNYQRFVAQEMHKRLDKERFGTTGFLLQLIAAGWHYKNREQLSEMADAVGRDRILVLHGTVDEMISVPHGKILIDFIKPKTGVILDNAGHGIPLERTEWLNNFLEEHLQSVMQLESSSKL